MVTLVAPPFQQAGQLLILAGQQSLEPSRRGGAKTARGVVAQQSAEGAYAAEAAQDLPPFWGALSARTRLSQNSWAQKGPRLESKEDVTLVQTYFADGNSPEIGKQIREKLKELNEQQSNDSRLEEAAYGVSAASTQKFEAAEVRTRHAEETMNEASHLGRDRRDWRPARGGRGIPGRAPALFGDPYVDPCSTDQFRRSVRRQPARSREESERMMYTDAGFFLEESWQPVSKVGSGSDSETEQLRQRGRKAADKLRKHHDERLKKFMKKCERRGNLSGFTRFCQKKDEAFMRERQRLALILEKSKQATSSDETVPAVDFFKEMVRGDQKDADFNLGPRRGAFLNRLEGLPEEMDS